MIRDTICFDDILLVPQISDIDSRNEISLITQLGKHKFRLPIISSPMDTVTESSMALSMFDNGGLGVVHRYNTSKEQCEIVRDIAAILEDTSSTNIGKISAAIGTSGDFVNRAKFLYDCGVIFI